MTDLQLGLVLSGLVVIFVIYGFNRWQEFQYKKKVAKAFAKHHQDVLLHTPKNMVRHGVSGPISARYEPSFLEENDENADKNEELSPKLFTTESTEPSLLLQENGFTQKTMPFLFDQADTDIIEDEHIESNHLSRRVADIDRDASLNPTFYFIAEVHANTPIEAATIPILSAAKRVRCIGLRADQQWEVVTDGSLGRYSELKIGLQLVDRQGPISAEDINAFSQTIQLFADEQQASTVFSPRLQKIEMAVELDQFCAETDMQVGLNLSADFPLSLEKIALFAEQENMILSGDGAFHFTDESGNTLFSLTNQGEGKGFTPNLLGEARAISFVLDVPLATNGEQVFDRMCQLASELSSLLGAKLIDDNQQPLSPEGLLLIRHEIREIQYKMQKKGVGAGSPMARQLYG